MKKYHRTIAVKNQNFIFEVVDVSTNETFQAIGKFLNKELKKR